MKRPCILIVDDDEELLANLKSKIKRWGYCAISARDGIEALETLENNEIDLVLTDQQMPRMGGLELLQEIKKRYKNIPFIMLTAYGTIDKAVYSIKKGANDYLQKPYDPDNLLASIKRSLGYVKLLKENKELKDILREEYSFHSIVTKSKAMKEALMLAEKVSESPDTTVTIYGESGTGKEVLSRAIHFSGERMSKKFVAINCAGIPSNLLESELFGHVKGAFTGADKDRDGKFDMADGGTVLFDEIGDMSLELQAKLLRVLQERTYEKVGSNKSLQVDFRIIAATHRDLKKMVENRSFREDLYHRINSFPIILPPLRERKEDIQFLANHFLDLFKTKLTKQISGFTADAMDVIVNYSWSGNVRELKNCIERAVILSNDKLIYPDHLAVNNSNLFGFEGNETNNEKIKFEIAISPGNTSLKGITDEVLKKALEMCKNNKTKAAELLGVNRKTFCRRKF